MAGRGWWGQARLVGYVVLDRAVSLARESVAEAELVGSGGGCTRAGIRGYVPDAAQRVGFGEDFAGWNTSDTGDPIEREQMRAWRDAAVDRIRGLRPERVLEIGVGSGLLLGRLAPECVEYWGTDFSARTIEALHAGVARQPWAGRVRLRCQSARGGRGVAGGAFRHDRAELGGAVLPERGVSARRAGQGVAVAGPGWGAVRGGCAEPGVAAGVRHRGVRRPADGADTAAVLRERVRREVLAEQELLLAPEFFAALPGEVSGIGAVDVELKGCGRSTS